MLSVGVADGDRLIEELRVRLVGGMKSTTASPSMATAGASIVRFQGALRELISRIGALSTALAPLPGPDENKTRLVASPGPAPSLALRFFVRIRFVSGTPRSYLPPLFRPLSLATEPLEGWAAGTRAPEAVESPPPVSLGSDARSAHAGVLAGPGGVIAFGVVAGSGDLRRAPKRVGEVNEGNAVSPPPRRVRRRAIAGWVTGDGGGGHVAG